MVGASSRNETFFISVPTVASLLILVKLHAKYVIISLACVSSETHNLQRVFRRILYTNGRSLCQAFLAETVRTGTKNLCVIEATYVFAKKA